MTCRSSIVCAGLLLAGFGMRPGVADAMANCGPALVTSPTAAMPARRSPREREAVRLEPAGGLWHDLMRHASRVIAGVDIDAPRQARRVSAPLPDRHGRDPVTVSDDVV